MGGDSTSTFNEEDTLAAAKTAAPAANVLTRLREPFPAEKVYQREGPGGKKLDYVSGETVLGRLLEVAPEYSWSGRIVSIEDGRAVVEGHLYIGDITGFGVGSSQMGADLDSSLKSANTEAIKNAAKNGFGIALELWDAEHRADIAKQRRLANATPATLKQEVYKIAKDRLGTAKPTMADVANVFGVAAGELADEATLRTILEGEGAI